MKRKVDKKIGVNEHHFDLTFSWGSKQLVSLPLPRLLHARIAHRVQIIESVESTPDLEAREHRRHSIWRASRGVDMEDMVVLCERQCR